MNPIYNTSAEIMTSPTGFRCGIIRKLSGLPVIGGGVKMGLVNGITEIELGMTTTDKVTFVTFDPCLSFWADGVLVFENLDGIEFTVTNETKGSFSVTASQLDFLCNNRIDHVALRDKLSGAVSRFAFHDRYTTYYDGKWEGSELFRIIANRISACRDILTIQAENKLEDVIQYTPVE